MPQQVANHVTRVKYSEQGGGAGALGLWIAPLLGTSDLARLGRIQARYALEQQLVVLGCEASTPASAERVYLGLRRREQKNASRNRAENQSSDPSRIHVSPRSSPR